jgi:hypothetical protein
MKLKNVKSLENLILCGHISGSITIFLGMVVIAMDLINSDFRHIQVGIFICAAGYAFVKIAQKSEAILLSERGIRVSGEEET